VKCKQTGNLPDDIVLGQFSLIFAPWFALCIHPLLISGHLLFPSWITTSLGLVIIFLSLLMRRSGILSGFSLAHGLSIYLFFPEEGPRISKGIYSYIRHPGYAMGIYLSLGFALLRNNLVVIIVAVIFCFIIFLEIRLEDEELIERFGDEHRRYIKETPAIFPCLKNMKKFLRLFFQEKICNIKSSPICLQVLIIVIIV